MEGEVPATTGLSRNVRSSEQRVSTWQRRRNIKAKHYILEECRNKKLWLGTCRRTAVDASAKCVFFLSMSENRNPRDISRPRTQIEVSGTQKQSEAVTPNNARFRTGDRQNRPGRSDAP